MSTADLLNPAFRGRQPMYMNLKFCFDEFRHDDLSQWFFSWPAVGLTVAKVMILPKFNFARGWDDSHTSRSPREDDSQKMQAHSFLQDL